MGRHVVGSHNGVRKPGGQAGKGTQEPGFLETSPVCTGYLAEDDQGQFTASHVPLGTTCHVDCANGRFGQRIRWHPVAWKPPSGLVGRCYKPGRYKVAEGGNRRPSVAVRMGAHGSDHFAQGLWAPAPRKGLLPPDGQYGSAQCSTHTTGQITWNGDTVSRISLCAT